jgi:signal transduction histidine kinase
LKEFIAKITGASKLARLLPVQDWTQVKTLQQAKEQAEELLDREDEVELNKAKEAVTLSVNLITQLRSACVGAGKDIIQAIKTRENQKAREAKRQEAKAKAGAKDARTPLHVAPVRSFVAALCSDCALYRSSS